MRMPPKSTDVRNPRNWLYHRTDKGKSPTCWQTSLFQVSADDCLDPALGLSCTHSGALTPSGNNARRVQIRILSNHTDDLLQVFMRPAEFKVRSDERGDVILPHAPPPPLWLQDEAHGSVKAKMSVDLDRCLSPASIVTCRRTYWIDIDKGQHRSFFWVAVVGKYDYARYVPFEFSARIINTGNPVFLRNLNISQADLNGLQNPG
jgi:hypothetical protein